MAGDLRCRVRIFPCGATDTAIHADSAKPSAIRKTRTLTGQDEGFWPQLEPGSATNIAPRRRINPLGVMDATAVLIAPGVSSDAPGGAIKSARCARKRTVPRGERLWLW